MAGQSNANDVSLLQGAVNDSAGRIAALWTSFLTLETYFLVATGSVKHRDLFLDAAIKLPIVGVDLPITGYFFVAPIIFVVFHFYLLLQLEGLSTKVRDYNHLLESNVPTSADRRLIRHRLNDFPFLQFIAGVKERRTGHINALLLLISWLTIVMFPLVVLLQMQIVFLPYHDTWITWLHRAGIVVDIALVWFFWRRIAQRPGSTKRRRTVVSSVAGFATFVLVVFSSLLATYPGEWVYRNFVAAALDDLFAAVTRDKDKTLSKLLFEGEVDGVSSRPKSLFANRIILPNERFYDSEKHKNVEVSVAVRGRDLRGAILQRADLRKADFTGANFQEASFVGASLQNSRFGCAGKLDVDSVTRLRRRASITRCDDDYAADLRLADFTEASMQGAFLDYAKLQGARFTRAKLQSASLSHADLTGATLSYARLEGASLSEAQLSATSMLSAQLQGADLSKATFRTASLAYTQFQGANLSDADFTYANLISANFYRAYGLTASKLEEICKSALCRGLSAGPRIRLFSPGLRSANTDEQYPEKLNAEGYKTFLSVVADGVDDDKIKKLIANRLSRLDPAKSADQKEHVVAEGSIKTDAGAVDRLRTERAEAFCEIICDEANSPFVVRAMLFNNRLLSASTGGLRLIATLHGNACPGTRGLERADFQQLAVVEGQLKRQSRGRADAAEDDDDSKAQPSPVVEPLKCKSVDTESASEK